MSEKYNTKKIVIFVLIAIVLVVGIFGLIKLSEFAELSQYKKELCPYDFQVKNQYDTAETCFKEILNLKKTQEENDKSISQKSTLDDETEETLRAYNNDKFTELATSVLDNTTAELEFENSEILKTFIDDGYLIGCVGENYEEKEYRFAFSSFLTFFRDDDVLEYNVLKYKYDCVYYICNTIYPLTFTQGIIDTFLSIEDYSYISGTEKLEETISYVSSSPEGIKPYEQYIETARNQLANIPKHYCVECGAISRYEYKSPFSGLKEHYCKSCYRELQELLDQFGID